MPRHTGFAPRWHATCVNGSALGPESPPCRRDEPFAAVRPQ
ncbi:hypothetical protein C7S14_0796 [Burkholderia cepacia]|nr:hypothetical protein [Burkholderia cepacia]QOH38917.1 hypothetical protein C7S14_0796 [Burkholderia cepacia]